MKKGLSKVPICSSFIWKEKQLRCFPKYTLYTYISFKSVQPKTSVLFQNKVPKLVQVTSLTELFKDKNMKSLKECRW